MTFHKTTVFPFLFGLLMTVCILAFSFDTRANVYATNIKLNGAFNNVTNSSATNVTVSFILNEPATLGTTIGIWSGSNIVRSINLSAGTAGTFKGSNSVVWDGMDGGGNAVASGTYNISITAAASGFTNWTQTSTDTNAGYYVYAPRGIAVNTNPNSKYYGRVFVGNAANNGSNHSFGNVDGIYKLNADGSLAEEGQTNAGYVWVDDDFRDSPYHLRYGQDDRIYALDFYTPGVIVACDMAMTTNQVVLTQNNYATTPGYSGAGWNTFDVTDAGTTNGRLWLGYNGNTIEGGLGVWDWQMINGVANTNDTEGSQVIALGGALTDDPFGGFMMDESSNIFVSQQIAADMDPDPRAMVFTNWDGMSILNNGTGWSVGANDDTFESIYDTALDTRTNPTYVACALSGGAGGIRVLYASNGVVVTNMTGTQSLTNLDASNPYYGVAWDAVGNLYGVADMPLQKWRVFSPPGTNQATTVALETVQVNISAPVPPVITNIVANGNMVTIYFTASVNDSPSAFTVVTSSAVSGPYTNAGGAVITERSPGNFQATLTVSGADDFFYIQRASAPPTPPVFTSLAVSGTTVTMNFTGSTNDSPSAFTLLGSGLASGPFTNSSGASMVQITPGHFQATVTKGASTQFYRLKR